MISSQSNEHFNKLSKELFEVAKSKGFYDAYPTIEDRRNTSFLCQKVNLILVEAAEAYEALRSNFIDVEGEIVNRLFNDKEELARIGKYSETYNKTIKGSVAEELADVVIRTLDLAAAIDRNLDFSDVPDFVSEEVNVDFYKYFEKCTKALVVKGFESIILFSYGLADTFKIDLDKHITLKTFRNKEREYMHGKKF